jgi:hypothetical protein
MSFVVLAQTYQAAMCVPAAMRPQRLGVYSIICAITTKVSAGRRN